MISFTNGVGESLGQYPSPEDVPLYGGLGRVPTIATTSLLTAGRTASTSVAIPPTSRTIQQAMAGESVTQQQAQYQQAAMYQRAKVLTAGTTQPVQPPPMMVMTAPAPASMDAPIVMPPFVVEALKRTTRAPYYIAGGLAVAAVVGYFILR